MLAWFASLQSLAPQACTQASLPASVDGEPRCGCTIRCRGWWTIWSRGGWTTCWRWWCKTCRRGWSAERLAHQALAIILRLPPAWVGKASTGDFAAPWGELKPLSLRLAQVVQKGVRVHGSRSLLKDICLRTHEFSSPCSFATILLHFTCFLLFYLSIPAWRLKMQDRPTMPQTA